MKGELSMRTIFMKYRPSINNKNSVNSKLSSPLISLNSVGVYSYFPCKCNSSKVEAYSKGILSKIDSAVWDTF